MEVQLEPGQPAEVERAVTALLAPEPKPVDPWWRAGLVEALDPGSLET
jgi:hypothetical protein